MPVYTKRKVEFQAADDSLYQRLLFKDVSTEQADSTDTHAQSGVCVVASGATETISFGQVTTGRKLFIEATGRVTLTIDGQSLPLYPPSSTQRAVHYHEGSFTSLTFTEPTSAAAVTVKYSITGT